MNALAQLRDLDQVHVPRRVLQDYENPLELYSCQEFFQKFRLSKESAMEVFRLVQNVIRRPSQRGRPLPPLLEFLGTLRFYATGTFQDAVGELLGMSQPSMSRSVKRVTIAIASLHQQYIEFPNRQERLKEKQNFMQIGGIPGVVGAIDCTLYILYTRYNIL